MTHVGALVLRNLSRFFHSARMPLSEFPGLAATVRNRDRMTTTRTGQTSHAFRKPSRRNRSPPCWTCGSWLMCFACKSETVKTTQDMKDRCGKHMNTSIKKLMDSIIITVDYRLWDVSLVAMIEMIEIFWEAKLLLTLQGLEPVARRDPLWGIRWASRWCFVRTASLVSQWCALTLASSCPLDSRSSFANALATWL